MLRDISEAISTLDAAEVDRRLDSVKDPCSLAAGTPLGLAEMGLIRGWVFDEETHLLTVSLCVTSPACFLSGQMADAIRRELGELPDVDDVDVVIDSDHQWAHGDATPEARERLSMNRAAIVQVHGIRPQMWREDGRVHEVQP
jgi:metal-sulfur cluster biosynthetic enzyme